MADVQVQTQIIDRDELQRFLPEKSYRLIKFFENLGKDVSSTLPDAIEASVEGPASATDNHVAVFDGTSGGKIKDSGTDISALAPLNSPAFTGTPTAPTPLPGDNSTRLATTSFVGTANANAVQGPVSATNNALALFDGTTGKLVKDSATLLTSLAPLASPALTGNPTAPTATVGDNDTSIATTAFVQGEFAARGALGAYFSAHNNATNQSIPNSAFTTLTMGTEVYDVGSKFASNAWTPPSGRPVSMSGSVGLSLTAGGPVTVSIFKNGSEYKRGTQFVPAAVFVIIQVTCQDVPNGTDVYTLRAFQQTGVAQNTDGSISMTWFQGSTIQA